MSTTPRTDGNTISGTVIFHNGQGSAQMVYCNFARQLETELAAAKAERDLAITRVASILWSGAIDKHTCGDVQKWAEEYTADLAAMQARAEKAEAALAKANATIEDFCTGGRLTCDQCLEAMPCNCGHSLRRP